MTWNIITPLIGAQAIADTSTTQKHKLGREVQAYDTTYGVGTFKYLKGVGSTAVGSWVHYRNKTHQTALAAAAAIGPLAVAMSANSTSGSYGWYQIEGTAYGKDLTSITGSATGYIFLSGTSGSVDDGSVAGDLIQNCQKTGDLHVVGTMFDYFNITRPYTNSRVSLAG